MAEVKEKPPISEDAVRAFVSRKINVLFLFMFVLWFVAHLIWFVATRDIDILSILLYFLSIVWLYWIGARCYVLRPGTAEEIAERYNRLRQGEPPIPFWDAYGRPRRTGKETNRKYTGSDAFWIIGGMLLVTALAIVTLCLFAYLAR